MDEMDFGFPVVKDLDDYMRFRAQREGLAWKLDPQFLARHYRMGVREFFGVVIDDDQLVYDTQQPALLNEWRKRRRLN
jgi:hypothetical protein